MVREDTFLESILETVLSDGRGAALLTKFFADRGEKEGRVISVGGALFRPVQHAVFESQLKPLLKEWPADSFHSADFYPGGGDFWRKDKNNVTDPRRQALFEKQSVLIQNLMASHVHKFFISTFRPLEYERVAPLWFRKKFGGAHTVAMQLMAGQVGHWANESNFEGDIVYFFETGDPETAAIEKALRRSYSDPKQREHCRMASTPIGIDKTKARGLDAADYIAWHWNRDFAERLDSPTPRNQRKDTGAFLKKLALRKESVDVKLFTNGSLKYFLNQHGCSI